MRSVGFKKAENLNLSQTVSQTVNILEKKLLKDGSVSFSQEHGISAPFSRYRSTNAQNGLFEFSVHSIRVILVSVFGNKQGIYFFVEDWTEL